MDLASEDNNIVTGAHVDDQQRLLIQIYYPISPSDWEKAFVMEADGGIHMDYNRSHDKYTIRDSHYVATGKPSRTLHRCQR
jgi:hypothetical protein